MGVCDSLHRRMKILVTRSLEPKLFARFEGAEIDMWPELDAMPAERFRAAILSADGVITHLTDVVDGALIEAATRLTAISQVAVGVDNIDLDRCTIRGIPVGHTPDVLTETTADTAWALLAAAVRRLPEGIDHVRNGLWGPWRPDLLLGGDLHGTTLGIVGLGRIGVAIARRALGFGMRVVYTAEHRKPHTEAELKVSYRDLDELLEISDHVVLALPLTVATRHLIDTAALERMKPTATLVNIARGPIIDTDALVAALRKGVIGGAALDVTDPEPLPADHPLIGLPNCIVIPHLGSASHRTRRAMAELAVDNLAAALNGERMPKCANPAVYSRREDR